MPSAISPSPTMDPTIASLRATLASEAEPLARRFRALFSLKHLARYSLENEALQAVEAISTTLSSPSVLLGHESSYCLGQTKNLAATPFLKAVLEDRTADPIVRHECAEALAALGDISCLELLKDLRDNDRELVVRETCEIAVDKILWENSPEGKAEKLKQSDFASIDPAPSMEKTESIESLEKTLLDTDVPLFLRYRAMFSLRDLASPPDLPTAIPAVNALMKGLHDKSALFRHEIGFLSGQLSHPASIPALTACVNNLEESAMVRHEALEALGGMGDEPGVEDTLKKFLSDKERVVRESAIVALDMAEFEKSGDFQYALGPEAAA